MGEFLNMPDDLQVKLQSRAISEQNGISPVLRLGAIQSSVEQRRAASVVKIIVEELFAIEAHRDVLDARSNTQWKDQRQGHSRDI
jgi:hypothetical protein